MPGQEITRPARQRFAPEQVKMLKRTVAKDCSDDEFVYFLEVCAAYNLDPLMREVYAAKLPSKNGGPGRVVVIVGRDGYLKIARSQPGFRGIDGDVVRENDIFKVTRQPDGTRGITHEYEGGVEKRGKIIGSWCEVLRDGHHPYYAFAPIGEYRPTSEGKLRATPWGAQESVMIQKCFSADTEVLTDKGFEPFPIAQGRILEVTTEGLRTTNAKPFAQPYSGPMISVSSQALDFNVTPNHDMVLDDGSKIEAGAMYEQARQRAPRRIMLAHTFHAPDLSIPDEDIELAAIYIADGYEAGRRIGVNVSRPYKIEHLRRLSPERSTEPVLPVGRRLTATLEEVRFYFDRSRVERLVGHKKEIKIDALMALSQRQAKLLVDTWVKFDGHRNRVYITRPAHVAAFEVAATAAGYSVSGRKARYNNHLTDRPNYSLTISSKRSAAARRYSSGPNVEKTPYDGLVWCATVPSGKIIVRRKGLSMVCGNCAYIMALRTAFGVTGIYDEAEMARADVTSTASEAEEEIEWGEDPDAAEYLRRLVGEANRVKPETFRPAKLVMLLNGKTAEQRGEFAIEVAKFIEANGGTIPDPPPQDAEVVS